MRHVALVLTMAAVLLTTSMAQEEPPRRAGRQPWQRYELLGVRNIFRKDRRAPVQQARPTPRPAAPTPQRSTVLTGVAQQGSEHVAFFEDARMGTTSRLRVGDDVAGGTLVAISLDSVQFELNGQKRQISIGMNLEGGASTALPITGLDSLEQALDEVLPAASSGASQPAPAASTDLLERLRQRRLEELGQ